MPGPWLLLILLAAALVAVIAVVAVLMLRKGGGAGDESLAQAWQAFDRGPPSSALKLFDKVIRATRGKAGSRRHAQAQLGRALCLIKLSKLDQAAIAQEAAL